MADGDAGALVQLRTDPGSARRPVPLWGTQCAGGGRPRARTDRSRPRLGGTGGSGRLVPRRRRRPRPAPPDPVSGDAVTGQVKKTEREEGFLHLNETPEEIAFELRAQEGALWTGGRLVIGIWVFAFASLAFAYFYLRSANNQNLWRPHGITAPTAGGAAIFAVSVACGLLCVFGARRFRAGVTLD